MSKTTETLEFNVTEVKAIKKIIEDRQALLEACREAVDALEWYDNGQNKAVAQGALKELREAIAKATAG